MSGKRGQKTGKGPRKAETYRAARRNAALRGEVPQLWQGAPANYRPVVNHGHVYPYDSAGQRARCAYQHAKAPANRAVLQEAAE
jgi:hypothetical protein